MEGFYNSVYFYDVMLIGFIAYGVYYLYGISKYYRKHAAARKQFLSTHQPAEVRADDQARWWVFACWAFTVYCIITFFIIPAQADQADWYRLAFLIIGFIQAGQGLLALVKRRILFADDGFCYEDGIFSWRSVVKMDAQKKGLLRGVDLLVTNGKHYQLPRGLGADLHREYLQYKDRKKAAKK